MAVFIFIINVYIALTKLQYAEYISLDAQKIYLHSQQFVFDQTSYVLGLIGDGSTYEDTKISDDKEHSQDYSHWEVKDKASNAQP